MCPHLLDNHETLWKNIFFDFLKVYDELGKVKKFWTSRTLFSWRNSLLKNSGQIVPTRTNRVRKWNIRWMTPHTWWFETRDDVEYCCTSGCKSWWLTNCASVSLLTLFLDQTLDKQKHLFSCSDPTELENFAASRGRTWLLVMQ